MLQIDKNVWTKTDFGLDFKPMPLSRAKTTRICLSNCFSNHLAAILITNYRKLPKTTESGDHITSSAWTGIKFLDIENVENKKGMQKNGTETGSG